MAAKIVVVAGDLHAGSTVGLCPADPGNPDQWGIDLDDSGRYEPGPGQVWLWDKWLRAWNQASTVIGKRSWSLILNGDLTDGTALQSRTTQIASNLPSTHVRCAVDCLQVPLALKPSAIHVIRGTQVHVGNSAELEEGVARTLKNQGHPVVPDPDTGTLTSYRRRIDIDGVRISAAHHIGFGQRPWTRKSYGALIATAGFFEAALELMNRQRSAESPEEMWRIFQEHAPATIAVRSHNHRYNDTGYDHRGITRLVNCAAWQLATAYVHRVASDNLADIGICLLIIENGNVDVKPILFTPKRESVIDG